ncbi:MAG: hypothetical protein ACU84J_13540 [Gammaproteobacteria bacterium]
MSEESSINTEAHGHDHDIRIRSLELEYELAKIGLRGTLIATLAIVLMVTIIITVSAVTKVNVLTGNEIVSIFAILGTTAVAYGAYVYKRVLTVGDKLRAGDFAAKPESR